jgi:hypothetical protein
VTLNLRLSVENLKCSILNYDLKTFIGYERLWGNLRFINRFETFIGYERLLDYYKPLGGL